MSLADDVIGLVLECAVTCLDRTDAGAPVLRKIVAGEIAIVDECCEGLLWVRVDSIEAATGVCADGTAAIGIEVGVARCAPSWASDTQAPSVDEEARVAALVHADAAALWAALKYCVAAQVGRVRDVRWEPFGPDGGCVGGMVTGIIECGGMCESGCNECGT